MIEMRGIRTQLPFTSWAWNLLGVSFAWNGVTCLLLATTTNANDSVSPWVLRCSLVLWEMAAPSALLVSCVIRYAIWPRLLKSSGVDTTQIKSPMVLIWHNANVIMVLLEVSLLGGLPIVQSHFGVAPLFGIGYIIFSWYMIPYWNNDAGPQFIYFFFDTTLGWTTSLALLILLAVLMGFYALFGVLDHVLSHLQGGLLVHVLAMILVASLVCRFRD